MIDIYYFDPEVDDLVTMELTTTEKEPNIVDALVYAFCYLNEDNQDTPFTYEVHRTEELDQNDLLGFVVGNNIVGFTSFWVEDTIQNIYLMREWLI